MKTKQEIRAEQTKEDILTAAGKLFAKKGYDSVSMREIAKEAGCSHTTIYIYFENKTDLLHRLSMPPLQELKNQMESILHEDGPSSERMLKGISRVFIQFCLGHRNMYTIFFNTNATRVDEENPKLELNQLRISLFNLLKQALQNCLPVDLNDDQLLAFSRIYFFTIHGIAATYHDSKEPVNILMERLGTTFDDAIEVLLLGFQQKLN